MAVPGKVRGGLPRPRPGIDIGGDAPGRLVGHKGPAVVRLSRGDIRGGQVHRHRGPGEGSVAGGRYRSPEVFADFAEKPEAGNPFRLEDEIGPHRDILLPQEVQGVRRKGGGGPEMPQFVKFPIVGEKALDGHAEDSAPEEDGSAVEEPVPYLQRDSCGNDHVQGGRSAEDRFESLESGLQQGVLEEEIPAGVGGDSKLREDGEHRPAVRGLPEQFDGPLRVMGRVRGPDGGNAGRHPDEVMAVQVEKIAVHSRCLPRQSF